MEPVPLAVFEQPGLAGPEVHDPAGVHQVVADGLDEAVVDDDVIREVLAGFGLDVVDGLEPQLGDVA